MQSVELLQVEAPDSLVLAKANPGNDFIRTWLSAAALTNAVPALAAPRLWHASSHLWVVEDGAAGGKHRQKQRVSGFHIEAYNCM
jgi:hypothetical protein